METKTIRVMESVYQKNDDAAAALNEYFTGLGVFAVNMMGSPGAGKTSSLLQLGKRLKMYVIEGDVESDIDTVKLTDAGIPAVQINTNGACHLDAFTVDGAIKSLEHEPGCPCSFPFDFLFIENIGNLICPVEFSVGEHLKLVVAATTEGNDKPHKYPLVFEKADVILINKYDLADTVEFDEKFFMEGVRRVNKNAPVFKVSGKTGAGFGEVSEWLKKKAESFTKNLR